uniref:TBC1 domain family member 7 n=1 Tax=Wuchereria bancrofti TaxID=6293 RepID=A0A1I8EYU5_WUCBA
MVKHILQKKYLYIAEISNMDRSSNFRTNFVGRMVGDKAECSRFQIEEQVLREDSDVDLTKLAQFAFKHYVPKIHRVPIWKLLLRVSSTAPEVRKDIAKHRIQEIAKQMSIICESNWVDIYWLTKVFDELLSHIFTQNVLTEVVDNLKIQLVKAYAEMGNLDELIWENMPMNFWIRCGGAVVFDHEPLLNLWDKVCSSADCGIIKLLSTVIYNYLIELKPYLSKLEVNDFALGKGILSVKTQNAIIKTSINGILQSGRFCSKKYET